MADGTAAQAIKIDDLIEFTVAPIEDDGGYFEPVFRLDVTVEREGLRVTLGSSVNEARVRAADRRVELGDGRRQAGAADVRLKSRALLTPRLAGAERSPSRSANPVPGTG